MRPWDDVDADDFTDTAAGFGTGIHRGAHGGDIAAHRDRHESAANLMLVDERDVGRLQRRIQRLDRRNNPLGFDHSDCFTDCHVNSSCQLLVASCQ